MSQNKRVLKRLLEGQEITTIDGYTKFHPAITRMAARISDLKDMGHNVSDRWGGNGSSSYKIYYLTPEFITEYKTKKK